MRWLSIKMMVFLFDIEVRLSNWTSRIEIGNVVDDDVENTSINWWKLDFDRTISNDGCWDRIARRSESSTKFLNKIKDEHRWSAFVKK